MAETRQDEQSTNITRHHIQVEAECPAQSSLTWRRDRYSSSYMDPYRTLPLPYSIRPMCASHPVWLLRPGNSAREKRAPDASCIESLPFIAALGTRCGAVGESEDVLCAVRTCHERVALTVALETATLVTVASRLARTTAVGYVAPETIQHIRFL